MGVTWNAQNNESLSYRATLIVVALIDQLRTPESFTDAQSTRF